MTAAFWPLALLMAVVAAAFVLVPLFLRRGSDTEASDRTAVNVSIYSERLAELDQNLAAGDIDAETHAALKTELQKSLLGDTSQAQESAPAGSDSKLVPLVFAALVPLFAIFAYAEFGLSWGAIADVELAAEMSGADAHDATSMERSITRLAERLRNQPDNDDGWFLLAQSYVNLQRYGDAVRAFEHLLGRYPNDPTLIAYHARAMYFEDGRQMTPRVDAAITRVLERDPMNVTMLEIRAMDAFMKDDLETALTYFQRVLAAGVEGERAELIRRGIASIHSQRPDLAGGQDAGAAQEPVGRSIEIAVTIADGIDISPAAPVFIFARAVNGPPMPLAARRFTRGDLPLRLNLDESMAMTPGLGLANFDEVTVVARISTSGGPTASPDDFEARSGPINLAGEYGPVELLIERQVKDLSEAQGG